MFTKNDYLAGIGEALVSNYIDNIQVAYELFKHYGIDLENEISELPQKTEGFPENGNILCDNCYECYNCINCSGCVSCKNCWCLCGVNNEKDYVGNSDKIENLRNEPLNEKDKKDLSKCIDFADYVIGINRD